MESLFALVVLFSLKGENYYVLEGAFQSENACKQAIVRTSPDDFELPPGAEDIHVECVPLGTGVPMEEQEDEKKV